MEKIILFDGDCLFCNRSVQFIIKRDPQAIFKFTPLKSEVGQCLLKKYHVPKTVNSLILIENNHYFSKSTAALKISKHLTYLWKFFYVFIFIPKPFRDIMYSFVANTRYKWFKKEACTIPSPEIKKRFL